MMFLFKPATTKQFDVALLTVRLVTGLALAAHGWQKVFSYGMDTVANNFGQMGIPLASVAGPFVSLLELVGGLALAAGLLTRPVALLLSVEMLIAAVLVHRPNGFIGPNGMELPILLATGAAALAIAGAGAISVDAAIEQKSAHT